MGTGLGALITVTWARPFYVAHLGMGLRWGWVWVRGTFHGSQDPALPVELGQDAEPGLFCLGQQWPGPGRGPGLEKHHGNTGEALDQGPGWA